MPGGSTGAAIGGIVQGVGTLISAGLNWDSANKARRQEKNIFNKKNAIKIKQYNMNQNRLAGLEQAMGGNSDTSFGTLSASNYKV